MSKRLEPIPSFASEAEERKFREAQDSATTLTWPRPGARGQS